MTHITVRFNKEDQLIEQRIDGAFSLAEFNRMLEITAEYVSQLGNPEDIRILIDAREMNGSDLATRKMGVRVMDDKNVKRLAMWGATAIERTVQRFMMIIVGEKRLRTFATEAEARAWLKADRLSPVAPPARPLEA